MKIAKRSIDIKGASLASVFLTYLFFLSTACSMHDSLPRNMSLKAFDPHRKDFVCKREVDVVPPIDPEADAWNSQALALTSGMLWPDQRDYKGAVALWTKAAERKHWKAMLNLANAYAQGEGVDRDTERAVQIVEEAMKLGVPGAYDLMGTYHMNGTGVKQDADRAYAFWQLAADMGSPSAMAYIGSKTDGAYDDPKGGFWGNWPIARKMLECSVAQGNGSAAYELGGILNTESDRDYPRALRTFQQGVAFGSAECADWLSASFYKGDDMVGGRKDVARSDRYGVLADRLRLDKDLRLPNLDKVLPLPPAPLPKWDGKKESLIDAAKAVTAPAALPKSASDSASAPKRNGRAQIKEGYVLPEKPPFAVAPQAETTAAHETGYWLAQLQYPRLPRHDEWNRAQLPMFYAEGELFDRTRPGLVDEDGRIYFHFVGDAVPAPAKKQVMSGTHPRVTQGVVREVALPVPQMQCKGGRACPQTGVWEARVANAHPAAGTFNVWYRQAYVIAGERFPDPREIHLDIEPAQVTWTWWNEANRVDAEGIAYVSVGGPSVVA